MMALWPKTKQFLNLTLSITFNHHSMPLLGFPAGTGGKEPVCQFRRQKRHSFSPWRRARQPTPVFLPGESYGQRSLAGYSPHTRVRHSWSDLAHGHYLPSAPPSMQESNVAIYKNELLNRNQSTTFNSH